MIDENDEINEGGFDEDLDLGGESFDSFDNKKRFGIDMSLKDKPVVKVGIIAAVIIVIVGAFLLMRPQVEAPVSSLPEASEVTTAPGTTEISPAIRDAIEEADQQRREEAERTAGSALPTLVEPPIGRIQLPNDEAPEEDPLQRWRRLQQERIDREAERARLLQPENLQDDGVSAEQIKAMADVMSAQMEVILQGRIKPYDVRMMEITDAGYLEELYAENATPVTATDTLAERIEEVVLPAGQIVYAQTITEANSDVPGPVLAEIVTGPLRGSRVLGAFKVQEELLVLTFNTIVRDGISTGIDAIALDPGTTLPAMATEVDHRYLKRVVLPAAAAFIEGTAEAIADSGTTTITISGDTTSSTQSNDTDSGQEVSAGIEEAAGEVSDLLDEEADRTKILVKVHAGTPMGLLFLQPVLKN